MIVMLVLAQYKVQIFKNILDADLSHNVHQILVILVTNDHWFQNPLAQIEDERREHHTKLIKMEKEMEEVFERKVSLSLIYK